MFKLIYFSNKEKRLKVIMFTCADDLMDYMASHFEDMAQDESHFVKVVKE